MGIFLPSVSGPGRPEPPTTGLELLHRKKKDIETTTKQTCAMLAVEIYSMAYGLPCSSGPPLPAWLQQLKNNGGEFAAMLNASDGGSGEGYRHTIREICQQPVTWAGTARHLTEFRGLVAESLASCQRIVLTGSGSSQCAGECAAPALERDLGRTVEVAGAGELLLKRRAPVAGEPTLVVSLARSGESPESAAVVEMLLETEPRTNHLIITCNSEGKLAKAFAGQSRVRVIDLGPQVNDRSLVMTSSFTNLVLGARFLGWVEKAAEFVGMADQLDWAGRQFLAKWPDRLIEWGSGDIRRIVYLGSGGRLGACRESALKALEMTGGRVASMAQTYLGLRHGPLCFIDEWTLVICYLSSDPLIRNYERDLIMELNTKKLGARKLIAGTGDPGAGLCRGRDLAIPYEVPEDTADDNLAVLDAVIGQILGFRRSLEAGLQPDCPSVNDVISRVVGDFCIHGAAGAAR
jgi:tagatose-6-phosphate ketose/aldose isomerase